MYWSKEGQRKISIIGLHLVEVMQVDDLNISMQAEKDKEEGKDAGGILRIKDRNQNRALLVNCTNSSDLHCKNKAITRNSNIK